MMRMIDKACSYAVILLQDAKRGKAALDVVKQASQLTPVQHPNGAKSGSSRPAGRRRSSGTLATLPKVTSLNSPQADTLCFSSPAARLISATNQSDIGNCGSRAACIACASPSHGTLWCLLVVTFCRQKDAA